MKKTKIFVLIGGLFLFFGKSYARPPADQDIDFNFNINQRNEGNNVRQEVIFNIFANNILNYYYNTSTNTPVPTPTSTPETEREI
jgi:hypothetical protein